MGFNSGFKGLIPALDLRWVLVFAHRLIYPDFRCLEAKADSTSHPSAGFELRSTSSSQLLHWEWNVHSTWSSLGAFAKLRKAAIKFVMSVLRSARNTSAPIRCFIKKNPTRCNNVSNFYYSIFIWSSTCFERHTAHHQEPKTALTASGFSYVEGWRTCSWWTLSGCAWQCSWCTLSGCAWHSLTTSTNYTSDNLPRMKNQRLPVQF